MNIGIRKALPSDAATMASLLNEIIERGGTTACETPFSAETMQTTYITSPNLISCVVAEDRSDLLGFQGLFASEADDPLPSDWGLIATFVDVRSTGRGIGRALFAATMEAARKAGIRTIDAKIRADNESGLAYYGRLGFWDYDRIVGVPLKNGALVDRVRKRFDL